MRNFVFDLYGTLVDIRTDETSPDFRKKFLNEFSAYYNEADFFEKYSLFIENETRLSPEREPDIRRFFALAAGEKGVALGDGEVDRVALRFRELSRSRLQLYPHITDMLSSLKNAGARLFVLSNAQSCFTAPEIRSLGLERFFDGIELSSDFGFKKPSENFYRHIINKYNLLPSETVYTGNDIEADIVGSSRVGFTSVYIKTAISPETDTVADAAKLASHTACDHGELMRILLALNL